MKMKNILFISSLVLSTTFFAQERKVAWGIELGYGITHTELQVDNSLNKSVEITNPSHGDDITFLVEYSLNDRTKLLTGIGAKFLNAKSEKADIEYDNCDDCDNQIQSTWVFGSVTIPIAVQYYIKNRLFGRLGINNQFKYSEGVTDKFFGSNVSPKRQNSDYVKTYSASANIHLGYDVVSKTKFKWSLISFIEFFPDVSKESSTQALLYYGLKTGIRF